MIHMKNTLLYIQILLKLYTLKLYIYFYYNVRYKHLIKLSV